MTREGDNPNTLTEVDGDKAKRVSIASPLESNGAVPVNVQDLTTEVIDLHLEHFLNDVTLTADTAIDDRDIDVVAGHNAVAGNLLCFAESGRFSQVEVISATATNIVFDSPLDFAYTTAADVCRAEIDMTVDGSVTPQIYRMQPPPGVIWHIVRILFHLEDSTPMDDGTFGGAPALTNGLVLRVKNGIFKNIFNVKTNGDFAERAYDREYVAKPPAGTGHAMNVRRTFGGQDKNGVVIKLDGDNGDELQVIIQDDLTGLSRFHCVVQGHGVRD
ncbi:hypothetical protein KAR91_71235 [Candidatus Pacearchaeota archaeon]|nr:hypothetical protein [Candidatus Pacearchaeota archaeon]